MEAIVAVGLAGNIIQVVDLAIRIVSKGHHIYHSGDGTLSENHDIEIVANDLLILQTRLDEAAASNSQEGSKYEDDQGLDDIGSAAQELARDLLFRLNMAKVQGRFRRWKSLRQALKSVWSKKEIDSMFQRLQWLKQQMQMRIIVALRYHIPNHVQQLSTAHKTNW
jgi:hypothetical protein